MNDIVKLKKQIDEAKAKIAQTDELIAKRTKVLKEKKKKEANKIALAERKISEAQRKTDNRECIILGRWLKHQIEKGKMPLSDVRAQLDAYLTRDVDKECINAYFERVS